MDGLRQFGLGAGRDGSEAGQQHQGQVSFHARPPSVSGVAAASRAARERQPACMPGLLCFGGNDALALIQHVYTNNAATLKDGQVRYGLVLNDQGGVRDDVLVYRWPYGYAMVVNASNRAKIVGVLNENAAGRDVQVR